ncbi:MAG: aminoacyl-tRNA hydrolase [Candidatus Omnitrophica bacterium]|nr:aminoacyl-tRNA hydrolase [Candidatus Omnitrophota bacterium]MCM8798201.1 aminoacyl-tRNA hydrolase [Candidatus Omnitrophota bacterium]
MKLIMGLGNPGESYKFTPHNLGFLVVDSLAKDFRVHFKKKAKFSWGEFKLKQEKVFLLKPLTFMNLSGIALLDFLQNKRLENEDILIICDDVNLPLGKIRLKRKGSDGGHLGLRSVIRELGTENFPRLRIGVGKERIADLTDYVLERFSSEDEKRVFQVIETAVEAVLSFLKEGLDKAMSRFN